MPAITIADLENAKLDVDHIAAITTSTAPTATDRLGQTKQTIAGSLAAVAADVVAVQTARNTAVNTTIPGHVTAVQTARDTAVNTSIPAAVALVDTAVAATAAGTATAARIAAEAARDAINTTGLVFTAAEGTAAGIAATTDREQFSVLAVDNQSWIVYRNVAESAVPIGPGTYTSAYIDSTLTVVSTSGEEDPVVGGFAGADDQAVFQVRASGKIDNKNFQEVSDLAQAAANISVLESGPDEEDPVVGGIAGADDQAVFQVRASGAIDNLAFQNAQERIAAFDDGVDHRRPLAPVADFLHFAIYGQSLSVGELGTPVRGTTARAWAKRFTGGVVSYLGTDPGRYASLVSLNETTQETIATGMLDMIHQLLLAEDGIDIATSGMLPFATASGYGGQSAEQLSIGSTHFTRLQTDITQGAARAGGAGKVYQPLVMPYLQGEQDYTIGTAAETWKTRVRKIRTDAEAYGRFTSGIDRPLPMIVYQLSQHIAKSVEPTLAMAAVELCADDYIGFATPLYFIPAVDSAHRNADGYYWLGAYFGLAIKRWLWDGRKPMPMSPSDVVWSNTFVSLRFPTQVGGLVLDTTMVDNPGDYGFRLYQSDGVTPISITGVSISGPDRVIVKAASIPAGARLRYAWENAGGDVAPFEGPVNGARGCLRDSRGATLVADPTGSAFPLHQFAPIFEEVKP